MSPSLAWLLVAVAALSLLVTLFAHACALRVLARRSPGAAIRPPVSVLKPLKGEDDGLYENLVSLARQSYPQFEIIFGAQDPHDPALEVARRVQREHPEVRIAVVVSRAQIGLNPKVSNLWGLVRRARHDLLLISDSNVRVGPDYLRDTVAEMEDARVGLVTNVLVGTGERTLASLFENLHLNSWVVSAMSLARIVGGRACVIGKSMLFRRSDLETVGGFEAVRDVLAEDYVLGRRFELAGFEVALSPHVVPTVNETWTMERLANRHLRWGQMRRRVAPAAFFGESLLNPVPWILAAVVSVGAARGMSVGTIAAGACATGLKCAADALLVRRLRGRAPRLKALAWIPVKDLLVAGLWAVAAFRRQICWRGNRFLIGAGTVLTEIAPPLPELIETAAHEAA